MTRRARAAAPFLAVAIVYVCAAAIAVAQSRPPASTHTPRTALPTRGPSVVIYPPERIRLRMNHAHPAHRALRCVRCHTEAGRSGQARDSLIPEESSCLPCHAEQIEREREAPSEGRCGVCHEGYEEGAAPPTSSFPTARLRFSHRTHVREGMRCRTCHQGIADATLGTRAHLPTMRQCFECHGPAGLEVDASAPSTCETCHLTRPDGMLRTRFREGAMNPPTWLFDMRHDHEWLARHRWVGADQGAMCAECHQESDCVDCHDGRVRPRRIHPGDFLQTHPALARRNAPRCETCHQEARFCTECHSRLGLSPMSAPDVRASRRYHPPEAVWVRGPNLHGLEARRAMNACVSCHAERDCVQCHGALGIGAGVSPHPPGFIAQCGRALSINDRACATCHGDLAALRERCR